MLTDEALQARFDCLGIPDIGRTRIRHIRDNLPSRAVRTNKMSGKVRYAPIKMPFVLEAEAFSTECAAMIEYDHDGVTDEFYPQAHPIVISYLARETKRRTTVPITPDLLRITDSAFTFVECKTDEELVKLAKKMPNRYQWTKHHGWRSPPAEVAAAEFGCQFKVRSSAENNWTLIENMELLKDYYLGILPEVPNEFSLLLSDRLRRQGWVSIFELVHMEPSVPADALYAMISKRQVFFPFASSRLEDQERALIFRDELTYQAHSTFLTEASPGAAHDEVAIALVADATFTWDGEVWKVINPGKERITVQHLSDKEGQNELAELTHKQFISLVKALRVTVHGGESNESRMSAAELLRCASRESIKKANSRYQILFGNPDSTDNLRPRMQAYLRRAYQEAVLRYGNGFVGLLPQQGGNRKPKASPESLALARTVIKNDWETIRRKNRRTSHGKYCVLAREKGLEPIRYVTFCKLVRQSAGHEQKMSRVGEKAAYDLEEQYMELEYTTPRHGVRAWHIGHIDHTPLPLKFVHSELGDIVSTIWLTILIDAFTRKIVAYYLSFDEPSHRSCMMVLRDCVRRHNRVHQILVCDQGSEFNSIYWEQLLGLCRITKRERRAGKPKGGSIVERVFNTTQQQFVTNLLGATDIVEKYFRSISPEVDPTKHAIWTLDRFDSGMERYLDQVYHQNNHSGIDMSPNAAHALSLRSHGERQHLLIPYGAGFIAQSCPAAARGTAKITPQGIKVNYRWFKCDAFLLPGMLDQNVPARYDPFNGGIAYAFVEGKWTECRSEHYAIFSKHSERAIRLATAKMRLLDRLNGRKEQMNSERLAVFLQSLEGQELTALQSRNDQEAGTHRAKIIGQVTTPGAAAIALPIQKQRKTYSPKILEDL